MAEITVHHLEQSRSFRLLWLLEELELDYKVKHYKRNNQDIAELYKIHPLGKSPVITTSSGETYAETGLIFEYILEKYDKQEKMAPATRAKGREAVQYYLHYSEGSYMAAFLVFYYVRKSGTDLRGATERLELHVKFVEGELSKHEWLAGGKFSAADIIMEYPIEFSAVLREIDISKYPKIQSWREKVKRRPAYKKALEANGAYDVSGLL